MWTVIFLATRSIGSREPILVTMSVAQSVYKSDVFGFYQSEKLCLDFYITWHEIILGKPSPVSMEEKPLSPSPSPFSLHLSTCKASFRSKKSTSESVSAALPDVWGVPLVSRAYDQDFPYAPVDPFKPSLLYSIRHIFPETPHADDTVSGVESDRHSSMSGHHGHSHRARLERVDYPFSPRLQSSSSTTRPLSTVRKRPLSYMVEGPIGSYSGHSANGQTRKLHELRYPHPYPSPSHFSPSIHIQQLRSPWQRDRSSVFPNEQSVTLTVLSDFMLSPHIHGGHVAESPISSHSRTPTARQRPSSETIIDIHSHFNRPSQTLSSSEHFQENSEGATITIAPNSHYLRRIPQLDKPPGPRNRRKTSSRGSIHGPTTYSRASHRKEQDAPRSFVTRKYIFAFLIDTLPRQIYLYFLLCLPYMYFSRVAHIFEEAEISLPKIKQGVIDAARKAREQNNDITHNWRFGPPSPSAAYLNLQRTWESFIDSLMREWKTLNIISVLLLSAILAILQIEMAVNDPVTVYTALLSMMCALMSLLYGCVYIIRFGSMRKVSKAAMWAAEAQRSTTCILWNVWVFLAMPATWLAWSMVMYLVCIMSLVWRTGSTDDPQNRTLTRSQALFPRTTVTVVLGLGVIYFALIMNTLRRYGHAMDRAWHKLATEWIANKSPGMPSVRLSALRLERHSYIMSPALPWHPRGPNPNVSSRSSDSTEEKSRNDHPSL